MMEGLPAAAPPGHAHCWAEHRAWGLGGSTRGALVTAGRLDYQQYHRPKEGQSQGLRSWPPGEPQGVSQVRPEGSRPWVASPSFSCGLAVTLPEHSKLGAHYMSGGEWGPGQALTGTHSQTRPHRVVSTAEARSCLLKVPGWLLKEFPSPRCPAARGLLPRESFLLNSQRPQPSHQL